MLSRFSICRSNDGLTTEESDDADAESEPTSSMIAGPLRGIGVGVGVPSRPRCCCAADEPVDALTTVLLDWPACAFDLDGCDDDATTLPFVAAMLALALDLALAAPDCERLPAATDALVGVAVRLAA